MSSCMVFIFPEQNGETIPKDIPVWENATVGTIIGSVKAIDRDLEEYSKINYNLIGMTAQYLVRAPFVRRFLK